MNRCIFVGRLTRDPEVSFSEKAQMSIARFTVAVDRIPKREGEPEADFFNCVAFDRKAEFVEQYWYSGMRVVVSGRMQNDNYTNKKGEKVYGVSLKADDVESLMERERQIMGRRRARLRPEQQILQMHQRHRCPKKLR